MNNKKVSVVIPIYGCKGALIELYERLVKSLEQITNKYEIILVNDNCPQNSWEIIEQITDKDKNVIGIELSRNFGQMKAILAGLDYSTGDYVVVMDCDLQDKPEEIINLYKKINEGYDIVLAKRKERKDGFLKIFVSKMFYKVYSSAIGQKYDPELCNFSISTRNVINNYCKMREEHRAFVMYLQWMGFKQTSIEVEHDKRKEGKSSYNFKKRIKMALDILLSQSDKFLKIIVSFGLIMSILSFIGIICLMGGIITFVVGIVGLYVGNIFMQVKERPLYIIRTIKNKKEGNENENTI